MPNYLLSLFIRGSAYAFSLFDNATNRIYCGLSHSLEDFKCVLYNTRPAELLFEPSNLTDSYRRIMT